MFTREALPSTNATAGTLLGMVMEQKLAVGYRVVQVVNADPQRSVAAAIRGQDVRATALQGEGRSGLVDIVDSVVRRRNLSRLIGVVLAAAPDALSASSVRTAPADRRSPCRR